MITRRAFLTSAAALAACSQAPDTQNLPQKLMAVTMDDFNLGFDV